MISKQNMISVQMYLLILEVSNTLSNDRVLNIVYNFLLMHIPPTISALWNMRTVWLCINDVAV